MIGGGADLPVIVRALSRAGWGELAGEEHRCVRAILRELAWMLNAQTGAGVTTAEQVASRAGYSERWTRVKLQWLEDHGYLTWRRGGVVMGEPEASYLRLSKSLLAALVDPARKLRDLAVEKRAGVTAARLRGIRTEYLRSKPHKRRSVHAELSASPLPSGGFSPAPDAGDRPEIDPAKQTRRNMAGVRAVRAALANARGPVQG